MAPPSDNAPVFYTMGGYAKNGPESSQESSAGKATQGNTEGLTLEERVRQLVGVEVPGGKGSGSENRKYRRMKYRREKQVKAR